MEGFEVWPFSIEKLEELFSQCSKTALSSVKDKDHLAYFEEYFAEFETQTVVVERSYVDHDYLEDYSAYYAKCFHPYDRFCARLHFFTSSFQKDDLDKVLCGEPGGVSIAKLAETYLGFIVVKPLPETFIGRTCLKTYSEEGRRYYPTKREYAAHLFGIGLRVDAVAFQEQDETIAACATSALWSLFHGTGKLFHHPILSPVEITRAATLNSDDPMRSFPNDGLTPEQAARAIRSVSLEPYFVRAADAYILQTTVYAYLKGQIPLLLDFRLVERQDELPLTGSPDFDGEGKAGEDEEALDAEDVPRLIGTNMGNHAVAVVGYSLGNPVSKPLASGSGLLVTATRIDKLYAHDDQVGPYARMELSDEGFLRTSFRGDVSGTIGNVWAEPENLLIPLYNKIRIPFAVVHDEVIVPLDDLLETLRSDGALGLDQRIEWDIYLITSNDLKAKILDDNRLMGSRKKAVLTAALPKYLWRASATIRGEIYLDLLFDATDIKQGDLFLLAIEYVPVFSAALKEIADDEEMTELLKRGRLLPIAQWFAATPDFS